MKKHFLLIAILLMLSIGSFATTWYPFKQKCPLCAAEGEYQGIASYGSYIYQWPSKYQLIFWPVTDSYSVYSCLQCRFTTLMWDFDTIPEGKKDTLYKVLKQFEYTKTYDSYSEIPITTRLEIAEAVYRVLGKDDDFWCRFYRIMGYHYSDNNEKKLAEASRQKAIRLALSNYNNPEKDGLQKENAMILAGMYYYTNKIDSTNYYLKKADDLKYSNKDWKDENNKNYNEYLSSLIPQFKSMMKSGEE